MRIVSLLPSATEICFALGLSDSVVAVTHECDFPDEAQSKPRITKSLVDSEFLTAAEIDDEIGERIRDASTSLSAGGRGIYALDEELLRELQPDLILTQELCAVCAVSFSDVQCAAAKLPHSCEVVSLEPTCVAEILRDIQRVGDLVGRSNEAREVVASLQRRLERVRGRAQSLAMRPKVFCMEWLDPPYCAGHWVPEMVDLAGGCEVLGQAGKYSTRVTWESIAQAAPEVVVAMPCGFNLERTISDLRTTGFPDEWRQLPAVRNGRVFATDANAYFSRCGPRVVDGIEALAEMLHPEEFTGLAHSGSWAACL